MVLEGFLEGEMGHYGLMKYLVKNIFISLFHNSAQAKEGRAAWARLKLELNPEIRDGSAGLHF